MPNPNPWAASNRQVVPVSIPPPLVERPIARQVQPVTIQQPQHDWGALTVPMVDGVNPMAEYEQRTQAQPRQPAVFTDIARR